MNESSKTILVIEDEETLLAAVAEKIRHAGYTVVTARDGEEGWKIINEQHPNLVLLDILLPKKNGIEVLEEMNRAGLISTTPVIVISNSGQPVEIDRIMKLGVRDYLIKAEFTPEEVLTKLKKALEVAGAATASPEAPQTPAVAAGAKSIMVVEDDKFLRDLIVRKLQTSGFVVVEAIDGNEAMRKLETTKPNLILLDLVMPGLDGFGVLSKMRGNPALASIPVVTLSNLGQQEDVARAKSLGASDYLIKAYFTPGEIVSKVEKILAGAA